MKRKKTAYLNQLPPKIILMKNTMKMIRAKMTSDLSQTVMSVVTERLLIFTMVESVATPAKLSSDEQFRVGRTRATDVSTAPIVKSPSIPDEDARNAGLRSASLSV